MKMFRFRARFIKYTQLKKATRFVNKNKAIKITNKLCIKISSKHNTSAKTSNPCYIKITPPLFCCGSFSNSWPGYQDQQYDHLRALSHSKNVVEFSHKALLKICKLTVFRLLKDAFASQSIFTLVTRLSSLLGSYHDFPGSVKLLIFPQAAFFENLFPFLQKRRRR